MTVQLSLNLVLFHLPKDQFLLKKKEFHFYPLLENIFNLGNLFFIFIHVTPFGSSAVMIILSETILEKG